METETEVVKVIPEPRRAGDPLVCECPVCARAKRIIEEAGLAKKIGYRIGFNITEDGCWGPEDGPGDSLGPNLNESVTFPPNKSFSQIGRRSTNNAKENVADDERRRLTVIRRFAWTADGRFA